MMNQNEIESTIREYILNAPENTMTLASGEPAWEECLIGFASGADPVFDSFKTHVGEYHYTPDEIFNKEFPDISVRPEELTVISWALLQRDVTRKDNGAEDVYPAKRWVMARFPGEAFNESLRRHVVETFKSKQIKSVAPILSAHYQTQSNENYFYTSNWSERHNAYAAGLGTFGLCDGLITSKGKAHRLGSVVAHVRIPPSLRLYNTHNAFCLYFTDEKCMVCAQRCPVDAITAQGHDKEKCWDHAGGTCAEYVEENFGLKGYGCGLCQTKVPCEKGIPKSLIPKI